MILYLSLTICSPRLKVCANSPEQNAYYEGVAQMCRHAIEIFQEMATDVAIFTRRGQAFGHGRYILVCEQHILLVDVEAYHFIKCLCSQPAEPRTLRLRLQVLLHHLSSLEDY